MLFSLSVRFCPKGSPCLNNVVCLTSHICSQFAELLFDSFVSRESSLALGALAAAADRPPALTGSRVDDLQALLVGITEGASHR